MSDETSYVVNVPTPYIPAIRGAVETLTFTVASSLLEKIPEAETGDNVPEAYEVTLLGTEWDQVGGALGKFPYAQVAPIMDYLRTTIQQQVQPAAPVAPVAAESHDASCDDDSCEGSCNKAETTTAPATA